MCEDKVDFKHYRNRLTFALCRRPKSLQAERAEVSGGSGIPM